MGAEYPPNPVAAEVQHLKAEGPGHCPLSEVPEQSDDQRQLFPPVQGALVQQVMPAASAGQAPEIEMPPPELDWC